MSDKVVNYSEELTAVIVARYSECKDQKAREAVLLELSQETGKTVKSLIAKLVREKVYVKKAYTNKTGGKAETKEVIIQAIANLLEITTDQLGGLEKATKGALVIIRREFTAAKALLAAIDDSES